MEVDDAKTVRPDQPRETVEIMTLEFFAPFLHLDQQAGPPQQIGEFRALALPLDPEFERGTGFLVAAMPERLKQPVAEDLSLALLIAGQRPGILDELADWIGDVHRALFSKALQPQVIDSAISAASASMS